MNSQQRIDAASGVQHLADTPWALFDFYALEGDASMAAVIKRMDILVRVAAAIHGTRQAFVKSRIDQMVWPNTSSQQPFRIFCALWGKSARTPEDLHRQDIREEISRLAATFGLPIHVLEIGVGLPAARASSSASAMPPPQEPGSGAAALPGDRISPGRDGARPADRG